MVQGPHDVVEVGVGDEEVVLADGELRPAADVERDVQRRHGDAGLVPAHRDALDGVPFRLHALALHLSPRAPVLFLFRQRPVQHRQQPAPFAPAPADGGGHRLPRGKRLEAGQAGSGAGEEEGRGGREERDGRHVRPAKWGAGWTVASGGAPPGFWVLVRSAGG